MKNMKPKTVLVTGAARRAFRGLGLGTVRHHLQRVDHVAAWVRSSGPALEALRSASPQLLVMQADISRTVQVRQAADTLMQHCAAVGYPPQQRGNLSCGRIWRIWLKQILTS
jgi:NAD(P)-dependent dehydrogenase (short-subunit alcohol dehydrogenase family)